MMGLDNVDRGEAECIEDDCVHVIPCSAEQDDLSLEVSENYTRDFSWFTRSAHQDGCALCEIGFCMQRFSGEMGMDRCVVIHGVLGVA